MTWRPLLVVQGAVAASAGCECGRAEAQVAPVVRAPVVTFLRAGPDAQRDVEGVGECLAAGPNRVAGSAVEP